MPMRAGGSASRLAALLGALCLAACSTARLPDLPVIGGADAAPGASAPDKIETPAPVTRIRHVSSIRPYGEDGGRMHLFLFEPADPRPMDERIRLAKAEIADDPNCRWLDAPRSVIESETARQGDAWADRYLVAPLNCT